MTLSDYLAAHLSTPFEWGAHDCTLFVAKWVKHSIGRDILDGIPKWRGEKQARRIIKNLGGIRAACDERLQKIETREAKDGDIALYRDAICLFAGSRIVGAGPDGLTYIDRSEAECAWRC